MKIKLLVATFLFVPIMLMAQVPMIRSPVITGAPSIEQPVRKMSSIPTPGMGENPQTLQFAVHPGTFQYDEDSAPKTAKPGATPMPAPAVVAAVNAVPATVKPTAVGGKSDGVGTPGESRINAVDAVTESLLSDLVAVSILVPSTQAPPPLPATPAPSAGVWH